MSEPGARPLARSATRRLLPTTYAHVVFTLPHQLAPLALQNKEAIYGLLRASAQTLIEIASDSRHLGAEIGFFSVLHTWNQKLQHHPHVHCVVAARGLSRDHTHWIHPRNPRFFLPKDVLSEVFRGKFVEGLRQAHASGHLQFHGLLRGLSHRRLFQSLIRQLFALRWVVYSKPPFGGPEQVLRYLGAYTHRVAISNRRLVRFQNDEVTFRWRDSTHRNRKQSGHCPSMSSSAASCCMCCHAALSASGTSVSWPAAAAVNCFHAASRSWLVHPATPTPSQSTRTSEMSSLHSGCAPCAAAR